MGGFHIRDVRGPIAMHSQPGQQFPLPNPRPAAPCTAPVPKPRPNTPARANPRGRDLPLRVKPPEPLPHPPHAWRSVAAIAALTFVSGAINIYSVIGPSLSNREHILRHLFPLEFIHFSRSAVLLIGYGLILLSLNILRRKRAAWVLALAAASCSAILHFTKGLDYEEASVNILLVVALLFAGSLFTVRSRVAGWGGAALRLAVIAGIAFAYGTLGFWLLDPVQFSDNFAWREAMRHAVTFLTFGTDPEVIPHTRYAAWFLHSLGLTTAVTLFYGSYLFFRPAFYTFRLHPMELREAQEIIARHGRSDMDFFKAWLDKSFFFSQSRRSFLAYRVGAGFAVVLGDPVGPIEELPGLIREFAIFCRDNDWPLAFHQATSNLLDLYEACGYHRFKVGDNAIVALDQFGLEGSHMRALRSNVNKIERAGYSLKAHEPPLDDDLLDQLRDVSDSWLSLPGHRERQFTLGCFDRKYLSHTTVLALYTPSGEMQAFLNLIPSHVPGDASLDLMRRRADSINGVMDYLFTKVLLYAREKGYKTFSLGMAPMSGFQPGESASPEEKAIHLFFRKWNLGFRYQGIRDYKAKFATRWEPRYVIYRNRFDLARLAIALRKVSEFPGMRTPQPEDEA